MPNVVCENGIYYTVYSDHAMVGKENASYANAYDSTLAVKNIEIKASINGVDVTEIQKDAFRLISGIKSITFPNTIKTIKQNKYYLGETTGITILALLRDLI